MESRVIKFRTEAEYDAFKSGFLWESTQYPANLVCGLFEGERYVELIRIDRGNPRTEYRITQNTISHYYRVETLEIDEVGLWIPGSEFSTYQAAAECIESIKRWRDAKDAQWVPVEKIKTSCPGLSYVSPALT
jgi:hypothetical protein